MGKHNTIKSLNDEILKHARDGLVRRVSDTVKDVQKESIQDVVYNAYHPNVYNRRGENGGLLDKGNMEEKVLQSNKKASLIVKNLTEFNRENEDDDSFSYNPSVYNDYLTPLIVLGHDRHIGIGGSGYIHNNEGDFTKSRDFIRDTESRLKSTNAHVNSMEDYFESIGIKVR